MRLVRCALAALCLSVALPLAAMAKDSSAILILPVRGSAASSFDSSVSKLIEEPLKKKANVAALSTAMKAARLKSASAGDAQKLGKAANTSWILVVEASGSKSKMQAKATLIDVASGKPAWGDHWPMPDGKITGEIADPILASVINRLHPPEQPSPPAAEADKPMRTASDDKDSIDDKLDPEAADAIDNQEVRPSNKHWQPGYEDN